MARDLGAAQDFYSAVLGWSYRPVPEDADFAVALDGEAPVAGLGATAPSLRAPVAWVPYFAVDSADVTASRVRERGATVAVGPLPVDNGRAALASDPDGAVFGFWEGRTVKGWSVGQGGGGPARLELRTRDAFAAAIFYAEVLAWASGSPDSCDVQYEHDQVLVRDGSRAVAALRGGAVESAPDPQVRPRWHVSFRVDDVSAAADQAAKAGGTVIVPPSEAHDGRDGREATLRDPDGALFTVTTV
ncbi:VOC family protein [Streptomyces sp. NPDC088725]|uniref:VOC family protein n=1 Tax=Streptomyces sp. NPDC088725 TaxID=3365873 RepID=UPI0038073939